MLFQPRIIKGGKRTEGRQSSTGSEISEASGNKSDNENSEPVKKLPKSSSTDGRGTPPSRDDNHKITGTRAKAKKPRDDSIERETTQRKKVILMNFNLSVK